MVALDGILMDFEGPFAGSKADGGMCRDTTFHLPLIAVLFDYRIFSDTAYPASLQVVLGTKRQRMWKRLHAVFYWLVSASTLSSSLDASIECSVP
jgi:hypothetical protein